MKKLMLLMLAITLVSCAGNVQHPDFENNKMLGQRLFQLHGEENYDAIKDMYHDDLSWTSPKYGEGLVDKETQLGYVKMYHDLYEDIYFKANYWLPDVDTLSLKNDGSVRVFGTWSGIHSETGNAFSLGSYHTMTFEDGKIIGGGDWFDLTGFIIESTKVKGVEEK